MHLQAEMMPLQAFGLAVLTTVTALTTTLGPQVTTDTGVLTTYHFRNSSNDASSKITLSTEIDEENQTRTSSERKINVQNLKRKNVFEFSRRYASGENVSKSNSDITQTESYSSTVQLTAPTESDWNGDSFNGIQSTVEAPPKHDHIVRFLVSHSALGNGSKIMSDDLDTSPTSSLPELAEVNPLSTEFEEPVSQLSFNKSHIQSNTYASLSELSRETVTYSSTFSATPKPGDDTWDTDLGFSTIGYNLTETEKLLERDADQTTQYGSKYTEIGEITSSPKSTATTRSQAELRQRKRSALETEEGQLLNPRLLKTETVQMKLYPAPPASQYPFLPSINFKSEHSLKVDQRVNRTTSVPTFRGESAILLEQPLTSEITQVEQEVNHSYREDYDRPNKLLVSGREFNFIPRRKFKPETVHLGADRGALRFNLTAGSVNEIVTEDTLLEVPLVTKVPSSVRRRSKGFENIQNLCGSEIEPCFSEIMSRTTVVPPLSGVQLSNADTSLTKNFHSLDSWLTTQYGRKNRQLNVDSNSKTEKFDFYPDKGGKNQERFHLYVKKTSKIDSNPMAKILSKNRGKAILSHQPTTHHNEESKSISGNVLVTKEEKAEHKSFEQSQKRQDFIVTSRLVADSENIKLKRDESNLAKDSLSPGISSQHDARQFPIISTSNLRPLPSEVQYPWSGPANYPYRRYSQFPSLPLRPYNLIGFNNRYNFGYGVADDYQGTYFGQVENRQQGVTQGQYYVDLPDGRRMIVTYVADGTGYYPTVTYQNRPPLIVRGTAQEIPNFNQQGTNSPPLLRYPSYPNTNHVHNLGPGHGLVTDEHFLDNHGLHFTPVGPDHIHDQDGPVFGFDRRPISIPSSGSSQPNNVGSSLQPNLIGNTLRPNFVANAFQPNFNGNFYPNQLFFPYQPQYQNAFYPYPGFWITPASQFYPNFANSLTLDQPSFASSHPPSAPNFGVAIPSALNSLQSSNFGLGIPSALNSLQSQNSFRPGTSNNFVFPNRNSLIREAAKNTIEEHLENQRTSFDSSRSENLVDAGLDSEDKKSMGTTVETDYVTNE